MNIRVLLAVLSFLVFIPSVFAVNVSDVKWQRPVGKKNVGKQKYETVSVLRLTEGSSSVRPLRIVVSLDNKASKAAEGAVLRCAFSMRLVKAGVGGEGAWAVPFMVEERRIAKVKSASSVDVKVYGIDMKPYLARLKGTGIWPDAVKVQLMVEPRQGDDLDKLFYESVVPVAQETAK
jgi:hypothetical protein